MKIALLGAAGSGKTAYFSGVYLKFRNAVSFRGLAEEMREVLRALGSWERLSFRLQIEDSELELLLSTRAIGLDKSPIEFPDATTQLNGSNFDVAFVFKSLVEPSGVSRHTRRVVLYDPPGGTFRGAAEDSDSIVRVLRTCDVFNVFIDSEVVAEAQERGGIDRLSARLSLGSINELISSAAATFDEGDIVPICFIISKFDKIHQNVTKEIISLLYNDLIVEYSKENSRYMICVCPTSIVDPDSGLFAGLNLEWPFIFSCAGTIFRNSLSTRRRAFMQLGEARDYERRAAEVKSGGWWKKLTAYLDGTGVNASLRRAEQYHDQHGRLIETADDDLELARRLWAYLAHLGPADGVKIMMHGKDIDPAIFARS